MATEVVLSPKRNVMDMFKTPSKVSDATPSSSNKKSQGILSFFTSTPRTPKPTTSKPSHLKTEASDDADKRGEEPDDEKKTQDTDSETAGSSASSEKVDKNVSALKDRPSAVPSSSSKKSKLRTNKQGKKKCSKQEDDHVKTADSKSDSVKDDDDARKAVEEEVHEQMDYEEFKKVLLQGHSQQQQPAATTDMEEEVAVEEVREEKEKVQTDKEHSPAKAPETGEENKPEESKTGEKPADDFASPSAEKDKRQLRTRSRSRQPMMIPSPVLSPTSSKSSKKDDSDLSLHGKDILEMTYEEYLKSIGAFDKSDTSNNESASIADQTVEEKTDNAAATTPSTPNTTSLYNYFSKTTKSTKAGSKEEAVTKLTVSAVVHVEPIVNRTMALKERAKNELRLNKAAVQDKQDAAKDDEIEILGSEMVEVEDPCPDEKTPVRAKGQKVITLNKDKDVMSSHSQDQKKKTEDGESAILIVSEKEEAVCQTVNGSEKSTRKTQATLQFKKGGGLEMSTAAETPADSSTVGTPKRSAKTKLKKPAKRRRIIEDDSDSACEEAEATPVRQTESANPEHKTQLRTGRRSLESDSGNDSKEFTPRSKRASTAAQARAQELLMKARQQADLQKGTKCGKKKKSSTGPVKKKEASEGAGSMPPSVKKKQTKENAEKKKTPAVAKQQTEKSADDNASLAASSRRQSSRLVHKEQEKKNYIELETDSESDDSSSQPRRKKQAKRKGSEASTPEKATKKSPKKAAGKLAPIFTKQKLGEAEEKAPPQPPEDPEVVRRRREFLMSGVPTELKRQAETTAAQAVVASEFAPFPDISHVQQRETEGKEGLDVWSLSKPEKELALRGDEDVDVPTTDLDWKGLQWTPISERKEELTPKDMWQTDRTTFSVEQKDLLLKEVQQTASSFAISALYDKFRARLDGAGQELKTGPQTAKQQSLEDSDVVVVDDSEETTSSQNSKGCQWTEVLQPTQAAEIVGNTGVLKRLRNWLEEWKMLIQKEARHTARMATNSSDFEMSDSEEEECNQLCNTVLLVGPHGVGKTSAVYALAQQLSYKVFEVNASSSRQGRHILAQLQEATQSHQVAQKKDGIVPTFLPSGLSSSQNAETGPTKKEQKKASAVPNAFANFFKKTAVAGETGKKSAAKDSPKKESTLKKKRRLEHDSDAGSQSPKKLRGNKDKGKAAKGQSVSQDTAESNLAGCLNLTSTSLILFDEVDLVFEEDTGFLQTVQHFINTTKIPIVMTTADPAFGLSINAKFEQLIFKPPSLESVTSRLQTVLLAAGLRTCSDDVQALAASCRGDLRQALLTLQFFALSGGGASRELCPLHKTDRVTGQGVGVKKAADLQSETSGAKSSPAGDGDSEDEFISMHPVRKPARRILDDDNDSKDGGAAGGSGEVGADVLPPVHLHLYKSLLGVSHDLQFLLSKCLQDPFCHSAMVSLISQCLKLHAHNLDIIPPNLLHLLPLPKVKMPDRWHPSSVPATKSKKRMRIADLWDSEASDEEGSQKSVISSKMTKPPASGSVAFELLTDSGNGSQESADAVMKEENAEGTSQESFDAVTEDSGKSSQESTDIMNAMKDEDAGKISEGSGDVVMKEEADKSSQDNTGTVIKEDGELGKFDTESDEVNILANGDSPDNAACGKNSSPAEFESAATTAVKQESETPVRVETDAETDNKVKTEEPGSKKCSSQPVVQIPKDAHSEGEQFTSQPITGNLKVPSDGLTSKLLSDFAQYYENLSLTDTFSGSFTPFRTDRSVLLPGIQDCTPRRYVEDTNSELATELNVESNVYAARRLWQMIDRDTKVWKETAGKEVLPEGCCIPLSSESDDDSPVLQSDSEVARVPENYQSVINTVVSNLPLSCYHSLRPISLHYLPTLRSIAQAEHNRQVAKTKRRFHHYFDNIGLCLNKPTLTALLEDFPPAQESSN